MLMKRDWYGTGIVHIMGRKYQYRYIGWFLLGVIPIYIERVHLQI